MKSSDLSPAIRQTLMPVAGHPGALAIVPPSPTLMVHLAGTDRLLMRAHEALAALRATTATLPNPNLILRTLDRREAVRSSQIEGSKAGVNHVFEYEATGNDQGLPTDVRVTLNYVKALDHGVREVRRVGSNQALTLSLIRMLHAILMDGDAESLKRDVPGQFRTRQNWIGGLRIHDAKIVPPPPEKLPGLLADFEQALHYAPSDQDQYSVSVIVRMAILHAQFELIHAFIDGNGRVGRMLMPLMLAAEGYPPVYLAGYLKANQSEYYRTLADAQLRERWPEWVGFVAQAVAVSCQDAIQTADDLIAIRAKWAQSLSHLRSDASALLALDILLGDPVVTVNLLKERLNVSFPAANSAIEQLKQAHILEDINKIGRSRAFVAHEVIARLDQPT
ncbi:MAG: Fic/DOC family N-terminal domain-containing protein [Sulfuritalea sp.]|nr:Fic/DOC family N-terminal domain-containing protein [Sulfuritalea sp.]